MFFSSRFLKKLMLVLEYECQGMTNFSPSRCLHAKTLLACRFVAFSERLKCNKKLCIRLLYNLCKNDHRTILCKNLNSIAEDCNILVDNLSKLAS